VTLIAAFRCIGPDGEPAVALCADSQETFGDYRVSVDKIKPRDAGYYDLIVGGAGNTAALIDGLSNALESNVKHWQSGFDEEAGRQHLERALLAYHARQVALYPAADYDKELRFLVCVRDKTSSQIHLWNTDGSTATTVSDYALIGWDEAFYKYEVKKFYRPDLSLAQTVLLGVDLLSIAKSTSNYVGGDTQVIIVGGNGMWVDYPEDVRKLEDRLRQFDAELGRLILASLDVSLPDSEFDTIFNRFEKQINLLRRTHAEKAVIDRMMRARTLGTEDAWQGFPYPKYSFDALVDIMYGRGLIEQAIAEAGDARKEAEAADSQRNHSHAKRKTPRARYRVRAEFVPVPKEILDSSESEHQ
jgi:20S proteasome alpha/beta subunit